MILGSEGVVMNSTKAELVDALRFGLSISPYSIPCDQNLGIELKRIADFEDSTVYKVKKIISYIDTNGYLACTSATLTTDRIEVTVKFTDESDTYYKLTLTE